jgi:hypothetical protein
MRRLSGDRLVADSRTGKWHNQSKKGKAPAQAHSWRQYRTFEFEGNLAQEAEMAEEKKK